MWALILIVYVQSAQSLDVNLLRYDIVNEPKFSQQICDDAGQLLRGPVLSETDPNTKYVWQDYKCVDMTK